MHFLRTFAYTIGLALSLAAAPVLAAGVAQFTGPAGTNPIANPQNLGDLNTLVNAVNAGVPTLAPFSGNRNFLDNGAMFVAQRGTAAATGGTTSGCPSTAYVADRWCVDTNVSSGAGKGQVVTSSPTPPAGFQNSMTVFRNSGALTQPVCAIQEIETARAVQLQGQLVVFSYYAQALAGMVADNGGVVNATIITGTGTDQGLGTLTASPAITPAWTGIASLGGTAQTITTSWVRYNTVPLAIPTTATEIGIELCFTPTATGAGATDGFAFTGAQLEAVVGTQTVPSAFEFLPQQADLARAQRFFYALTESNTNIGIPCFVTGSNTQGCYVPLPVTMRAAPTVTVTAGGFKEIIDGAAATAVVTFAGGTSSVNSALVTTANTTTAAVHAVTLVGSATTGSIQATADF